MIDIEHPQTNPPEDEPITCPICHDICEILFEDINGIVFGCDVCVKRKFIV